MTTLVAHMVIHFWCILPTVDVLSTLPCKLPHTSNCHFNFCQSPTPYQAQCVVSYAAWDNCYRGFDSYLQASVSCCSSTRIPLIFCCRSGLSYMSVGCSGGHGMLHLYAWDTWSLLHMSCLLLSTSSICSRTPSPFSSRYLIGGRGSYSMPECMKLL